VIATEAPRAALGIGRLDRLVEQRGSLRAAAVLRVLVGAIVIRHLWAEVGASVLPVDRFHVPWWSWLPEPSHDGYRMLLYVGITAGTCMVIGLASRVATITAFVVVSYLLVVDMTGFAHNRGFLVWVLFGLALLPARPEGYVWPLVLLRVIVSSVYLTSGTTKLAQPDWRSGLVLWDRVVRYERHIPFGGWVHDVLTTRITYEALAPAAIGVELFIGVAIWLPRTRLTAIWVAIVFHTSIEIAANVQTFSYTAIAALLIWVTPRERDRTLTVAPPLSSVISRLDWLHRFNVVRGSSETGAELVDRDGTVHRGRAALLATFSRIPVLFPVTAPWLAVRRLTATAGRTPVARIRDAHPAPDQPAA
jgi:hypothetical protein